MLLCSLQVLRDQINTYMADNPSAKLYVTGHSLGKQLCIMLVSCIPYARPCSAR